MIKSASLIINALCSYCFLLVRIKRSQFYSGCFFFNATSFILLSFFSPHATALLAPKRVFLDLCLKTLVLKMLVLLVWQMSEIIDGTTLRQTRVSIFMRGLLADISAAMTDLQNRDKWLYVWPLVTLRYP